MSKTNPSVDGYIRKQAKWSKELTTLREILLECDLTEEIKWRAPCYTWENHNVCFIGSFKDHCALSFIKGVLLKDPKNVLEILGPNTQSVKIIRFYELKEIEKLKTAIKSFVKEAIALEKAGVKVDLKAKHELVYPDELETMFKEAPEFKTAFEALTPGRKRAWIMQYSSAKQSATRTSRIEKSMDKIYEGKGPLDDYQKERKC